MDSGLATAVRSQCRVDILRKHVPMHLEVVYHVRSPPTVAAAEEPELKHAAATWMGNSVDLVELDSDQPCEDRFVGIVHNAATLHNVWLIFEKALGCPANVMRVGTVVGIEDAGEVCWCSVCRKEVIKIICL